MAYTEIAGRTLDPQPTQRIIRTLGVCAADSEAPKPSDELGGTTYTIPPICVAAQRSYTKYPGRIFVQSVWVSPKSAAEFAAGTV